MTLYVSIFELRSTRSTFQKLSTPNKTLPDHPRSTPDFGAFFCDSPRANALRQPATTMSLNQYMNKKILIITVDGRTLIGTLVSCDQVTNLVLKDTVER
ncbi:hypothetical protein KCU78_g24124, partial [Aureobasidium melanogenum]